MKTWAFTLLLVASSVLGFAQRHKLEINTETEEGKLLQHIGTEADAAKKLALLEEFASKHPKHESAVWVWSQLQKGYAAAHQFDKAIEAGKKVLAADPEDLETAYGNLKAAEAKKDADAILASSAATSSIARKIAGSPQPGEADQVEFWKQRVDYAKQVDTYAEYALFAAALQPGAPQKSVALVEALVERNPKSQYLSQAMGPYLIAVNQSAPNQLLPTAEKMLNTLPDNEELLLVLADGYMNQKQNDKALQYANKLTSNLKAKQKPEGMTDADWEAKKTATLGRGYWIEGIIYASTERFPQADQSLRAALPLVKGNEQMTAGALFYLGLANYRLGQKSKNKAQISEALRFSEQAAAIKSPFQTPAATNVKAIRQESGSR